MYAYTRWTIQYLPPLSSWRVLLQKRRTGKVPGERLKFNYYQEVGVWRNLDSRSRRMWPRTLTWRRKSQDGVAIQEASRRRVTYLVCVGVRLPKCVTHSAVVHLRARACEPHSLKRQHETRNTHNNESCYTKRSVRSVQL